LGKQWRKNRINNIKGEMKEIGYREDSVANVAMDITELLGGRKVVQRQGRRGGHFLISFSFKN
jgi:hypothetical protein